MTSGIVSVDFQWDLGYVLIIIFIGMYSITDEKNADEVTAQHMRKFVEKMDSLNKLLMKYNDAESIANLEKQKEQLRDMLAVMNLDEKGQDKNSMSHINILHLAI